MELLQCFEKCSTIFEVETGFHCASHTASSQQTRFRKGLRHHIAERWIRAGWAR